MTSGVPKKYHGGTLGVPQWYRSTAGWVFPLHATHCTTARARRGLGSSQKVSALPKSGLGLPNVGIWAGIHPNTGIRLKTGIRQKTGLVVVLLVQ